MCKKELIQVDFYPDGRIVKIYSGEDTVVESVSVKPKSAQEQFMNRVEKYKEQKRKKKNERN